MNLSKELEREAQLKQDAQRSVQLREKNEKIPQEAKKPRGYFLNLSKELEREAQLKQDAEINGSFDKKTGTNHI